MMARVRRGPGALRPAGAARAGRRARRPRAGPPPRAGRRRPRETVAQPVKVDNDLYVRDYSKLHPLLQVRRGLRRRTPRTRSRSPSPGAASTPASPPSTTRRSRPPPASTAATASGSARPAPSCSAPSTRCARPGPGTRRPRRVTDTICPYCGVGCTLTLHVQDNTIVKVTSPMDSSVTEGHLCIKGRFGFAVRPGARPKG